MPEKNIFQKIIDREVPSTIEYEDDTFIVIHDIHPKAPVHLLIIPKKPIISVAHLKQEDEPLMGKMIMLAKQLADKKQIKGYKLIFNVGPAGGQEVDHLHLHLLGYMGAEA